MSKKINAFKNMCQDDQIALLKGGCTEMMILRSAMTYDPDRDSWKVSKKLKTKTFFFFVNGGEALTFMVVIYNICV